MARASLFSRSISESRSGTIHYADTADEPGKKIWSWGHSPNDGNAWVRKNLSDNGTTYAEIQAGLFRDQETYEFLDPEQVRTFNEYWMPARDLGGISRANLNAAVNLQRSGANRGKVDLTIEVHPGADAAIQDPDSQRIAGLGAMNGVDVLSPPPAQHREAVGDLTGLDQDQVQGGTQRSSGWRSTTGRRGGARDSPRSHDHSWKDSMPRTRLSSVNTSPLSKR